jgi:hypothetical protein
MTMQSAALRSLWHRAALAAVIVVGVLVTFVTAAST